MPRAPRGGIGPDLLVVMLKEGKKKKKLDSGISISLSPLYPSFSLI